MEFHEKLQELRKSRGLTQEELAEDLYVSRTAVSKWESGRGYPSIDSLKEISKYFSVTIDDLLSSEKVLFIAEKENRSNLQGMCNLLFGMVDICSVFLFVLPIYPNKVEGFVYSVNLFDYTQTTEMNRWVYVILFSLLVAAGVTILLLTKLGRDKWVRRTTAISMILSILSVLFLAVTRGVYALIVMFLLLVIKGFLLSFKNKEGKIFI